VGGTCSTDGRDEICTGFGQSEDVLGKPVPWWEDVIKINVREIRVWGCGEDFVNLVMNLWVP